MNIRPPAVLLLLLLGFTARIAMYGQSTGNAGTINGSVLDPTGAAIPGPTIQVQNPVSHYNQTVKTDDQGNFLFVNIPFNNYHLTTQASGFQSTVQEVDVRSPVPLDLKISLMVGAATTSVEVTAAPDLLEGDPTPHTDVDRALFDKLPLESAPSSLSSLVTLASPGVAADSNGLFHGLGDHASNSFSLDGQPITDQQSKVFFNQIPLDAVQSLEVIQGAPPAEYGGKTSLIIDVTTRSGQGQKTPTGDVTASYGTFGTSNGGFNFGYGGDKWGNFISANFLNAGRFLDAPEFTVMHEKGNEGNVFDRVDYQFSEADSIHLDMQFTRSWFQNPNTYDQEYHPGIAASGEADVNPITGAPLGPSYQRSKITTFDSSPTWTHLINPSTVFTFGAYARLDQFNYYPSADPFADLSPDLQNMSVSQSRRLFNAGVRSDVSYIKGIHNLKVGIQYQPLSLPKAKAGNARNSVESNGSGVTHSTTPFFF